MTPPVRERAVAAGEVEMLYAAHRLDLVRLAWLLLGDLRAAEEVVQVVFVGLQRRAARPPDAGLAVQALRSAVVRECRRSAAPSPSTAPAGPRRDVEIVALRYGAGLSERQAATAMGISPAALRAAEPAAVLRYAPEAAPGDRRSAAERLGDLLGERAGQVGPASLGTTYSDVLAQHLAETAVRRRRLVAVLGALLAVALATTAVTLARRPAVVPRPPALIATSTPITPPVRQDGAASRDEIPWTSVGPGWVVALTTPEPGMVSTDVYLVSPAGSRYDLGSVTSGTTVQDVSLDGQRILLASGGQAYEWDPVRGTARSLPVTQGLMAMRYAGTGDGAYLVVWADPNYTISLERRAANGEVMVGYSARLLSRDGQTSAPTVLPSGDGSHVLVGTRANGRTGLAVLDVRGARAVPVPMPDGETSCGPVSRWGVGEALVECGTTTHRLYLAHFDGTVPTRLVDGDYARAWRSSLGPVLQSGSACSTTWTTSVNGSRVVHTAPGIDDAVVNTVVVDTVYLGGTRCARSDASLLAYDIRSRSLRTLLTDVQGPAVVIDPAR